MNIFSLIVVGAIVLAWVIGAIAEQQRRAQKPPPLPPMPDQGARAARTREELADFLSEIRRKAAAEETKPLQAILVEEPAPKPEPRREKPRAKAKPTSAPAPPRRSAQSISQDRPAAAPEITARKQSSPVVTDVVQLLRSPSTLAAAVLLREVLDPPRCRRRRGR